MRSPTLLHDLVAFSAAATPDAIAISSDGNDTSYATLQAQIEGFARGLATLDMARSERIAVYMEKRIEAVVTCFGSAMAACIFVPINPLLKAEQVAHILRDSEASVLVTTAERLAVLAPVLGTCHGLRHVVVAGEKFAMPPATSPATAMAWGVFLDAPPAHAPRHVETDAVAILYTSGSTGKPKGVILSHRNMVVGAESVSGYLGNRADDSLLGVLPLSFDAGFSQLTTAFRTGACVVLLNYLMPRDVLKALSCHRITGITAVPPLYIQLSGLEWPPSINEHLRYFANTGGRMPGPVLKALRQKLPAARPFLMYGLTEAFRSTFLPPEEIDRRPDSIGRAIPNAEILVLDETGRECADNEPGELVHRGPLVGLGYWNDPEKTAERFRPLPHGLTARHHALPLAELAVYSGDTVRRDEEGFFYFIGRRDEMIKTSGYRVSPTEIEEVLYATRLVGECAAFGVPHPLLGESIRVIATPAGDTPLTPEMLLARCREHLPAYMIPEHIVLHEGPLPRSANGKIDRQHLRNSVLPTP